MQEALKFIVVILFCVIEYKTILWIVNNFHPVQSMIKYIEVNNMANKITTTAAMLFVGGLLMNLLSAILDNINMVRLMQIPIFLGLILLTIYQNKQ